MSRLTDLAAGWTALPVQAGDDAGRVDLIRALEVVKAAAAATQARLAADLDASQRQVQEAAGVPAAERGRGVDAQVALARRDSPHRGGRHLGLAKALVHEMPHTLAALQAGRVSEWRATILVRESAVLTAADRTAVDAELAGDADRLRALEQLGDRALAARVKQVAYRLDPRSVVERSRRAEGERCVTVRPAPDTMAYLTALLPARDAIAAHASLGRAAEAARNHGDPRGRGQLMADLLVDRLTGAADLTGAGAAGAAADAGGTAGGGVAGAPGGWAATIAATTWDSAGPSAAAGPSEAAPMPAAPSSPRTRPGDIAVHLVMTDRALLDGDDEPAHLDGYGPVPAGWARQLVADALDRACTGDGTGTGTGTGAPGVGTGHQSEARVFLTRLITDRFGALVAMESRARTAPRGLADLVRTRDGGTCRNPWCDAPVRHVDHVVPHAAGGPTSSRNSQGLCERCNYVRQALGWHATAHDPPVSDAAPLHPPATSPPGEAPGDPPMRHTVFTTTPTGHTYVSTAPPLPGAPSPWPGAQPSVCAAADVGDDAGGEPDVPRVTSASWIEPWLREQLARAA
ncbi:DUF222 domain-containing protein [Jannaschia sp. R86511]|uniref:HNH endonuclease n=1 Tax=Jannaschia sp. R86511 TaxID=3093853 RepID=UPI0036D3ADFD